MFMLDSHKHVFSIFISTLAELVKGKKIGEAIQIDDSLLISRIVNVLRIRIKEDIIFFDKYCNGLFTLHSDSSKGKQLFFILRTINKNRKFDSEIVLGVGLLKKAFFEQVLYFASQMGANKVVPILTERISKNWLDDNSRKRMKKILVSGAEQSKSFLIPEIEVPVGLIDFLKLPIKKKICFDGGGDSLISLLIDLNKNKPDQVQLLFGPEAGFTDAELILIKEQFEVYSLTSTVLRSVEAVSVGLGSIRSVII